MIAQDIFPFSCIESPPISSPLYSNTNRASPEQKYLSHSHSRLYKMQIREE